MIRTDREVFEMLERYMAKHKLSATKICNELQINKNTFTNWRNGKPISAVNRSGILSLICDEENNLEHFKATSFPVISSAAAAECNTAYMPIAEYAELNAEEHISFTKGKPGDFVIRVTGNSMLPWYPEGTFILVRPYQTLKNGDRVAVVLQDGEIVFKCFAEKGDSIYLLSINEQDGQDFQFKKNNYTAVRAVYLVIQSMRDEIALDKAMKEAGIHHFWEKKLKELD